MRVIHARHSPKYPAKFVLARKMRWSPTPSERILWEILRARPLGFRFRRQSIILGWIADFYCPQYKLIIEVDGGYHTQQSQRQRDAIRDQAMRNQGFQVIRLSAEAVIEQPLEIISELQKIVEKN